MNNRKSNYAIFMQDPRVKEAMAKMSPPEAEYYRRNIKAMAFFSTNCLHQGRLWAKLSRVEETTENI